MRRTRRIIFLAALACALAACGTRPRGPEIFSFAMMGDTQYRPAEEELFPEMLKSIDDADVEFVVHIGDFKAGSNAACTDELYQRRYTEFSRSKHPLIYLPGDNEWVDCRRPSNGPFVPLERLQKLREIFFAKPESLGQKRLTLTRESDVFASDADLSRYRENTMWEMGSVVFVTLNIQGSNDNKGFDADNDREHIVRTRANVAWLKHAMVRAKRNEFIGLVVFQQANPGFEENPESVGKSGFHDFLAAFEIEARAFGKPILFAHGDSHQFRIMQPYLSPLDKRPIANVTRLETYGSPFTNWVHVTVDSRVPHSPFFISSGNFGPPIKSQ
jgi:Calcineurin-like phosphoesterase